MNEIMIIIIIAIFGIPIVVAIAVLFSMYSMDKQQKEMLRENEEYYQKMQSGKENHEVVA